MIDRRGFVSAVAIGVGLFGTTSLSACQPAPPPSRDTFGGQLLAFFKTGDASNLQGLFNDNANIFLFYGLSVNGTFGYAFTGAVGVTKALEALLLDLTECGFEKPCSLTSANLSGHGTANGANKLSLRFEEPEEVEPPCDFAKAVKEIDIIYDESSKRLAVIPNITGGRSQ